MPSPRDAEIARLRDEAARLREESAAALDRGDARAAAYALDRALLREEMARLLGERPSTEGAGVGTLGTPMQTAQPRSRGAAVSEARTDKKTRTLFQRLLHERNASLPEWVATQKGLDLEVAKSWVKRKGHGARAVPRAWADKLAKEFREPALSRPESWPAGIRE